MKILFAYLVKVISRSAGLIMVPFLIVVIMGCVAEDGLETAVTLSNRQKIKSRR